MLDLPESITDILATVLGEDREPLTSPQKLAQLVRAVRLYKPRGPIEPLMFIGIRAALDRLQLPEDPAEVDELLQGASEFMQGLKSDPGSRPCTCGAGAGPEPIGAHDPDCPRAVTDTTAEEA